MKKSIKLIIAEGAHDVAFLARLMKANAYIDPEIRVKNIEPVALRDFIIGLYQNFSFKRNVKKINRRPIPLAVLCPKEEGNNEIAVLFAADGVNNYSNIETILKNLVALKNNPFGQESLKDVDVIKVIFNIDADDKGIEDRIATINSWTKKLTDEKCPDISNFNAIEYKGIKWGVFISANNDGLGALEDLVLPLFEINHNKMVEEVKRYISQKDSFNIPQTKKPNDAKSEIGIMGQLDMPGVSNTVLIDQSKLIDDERLKTGVYKKISDFISEL